MHLIDLSTDMRLAASFYYLSRLELKKHGEFKHNYNVGFSIVSMAIVGPYII